jgi:hypothetical protein
MRERAVDDVKPAIKAECSSMVPTSPPCSFYMLGAEFYEEGRRRKDGDF